MHAIIHSLTLFSFLDNSYENEGQDDDQKLPGKINSPPKCKINLLRKRRRKFSPKKVVTQSLNGKPPSCAKKTRGHNKATTVDQFKLRPPSTPDGKFPCSKCGLSFLNKYVYETEENYGLTFS